MRPQAPPPASWYSVELLEDPGPPRAAAAELARVLEDLDAAASRPKPRPRALAAVDALDNLSRVFEEDREGLARARRSLASISRSSYKPPSAQAVSSGISEARALARELRGRYSRAALEYELRPRVYAVVYADGAVPAGAKFDLVTGPGSSVLPDIVRDLTANPNLTPVERDRAIWLMDRDARAHPGRPRSSQLSLFGPNPPDDQPELWDRDAELERADEIEQARAQQLRLFRTIPATFLDRSDAGPVLVPSRIVRWRDALGYRLVGPADLWQRFGYEPRIYSLRKQRARAMLELAKRVAADCRKDVHRRGQPCARLEGAVRDLEREFYADSPEWGYAIPEAYNSLTIWIKEAADETQHLHRRAAESAIPSRAPQLDLFGENPPDQLELWGAMDRPLGESLEARVAELEKRKGAILAERDEINVWKRALRNTQGAHDPEYEREMDAIRRQLQALKAEYDAVEAEIARARGTTPREPRRMAWLRRHPAANPPPALRIRRRR